MSNNNSSSSGIGVFGVVGIVFIVLKCVGTIDWSWWWVLSPFWIGFAFWIVVIAVVFIVIVCSELSKGHKFKNSNIYNSIKKAQENAERKKEEN